TLRLRSGRRSRSCITRINLLACVISIGSGVDITAFCRLCNRSFVFANRYFGCLLPELISRLK
ncbi:MAG: hypothetical protein ACYC27_20155, partial [Armatimonadota bacterium]